MTDQPGSARFQALLESALQVYEKKAGVRLANLGDSLVIQVQHCYSIDDITTLLQDKAQAFDDLQQRDRILKSIKATVSILTPVSAIVSVADDAGLVRQKVLKACLPFLTVLQTLLPHTKAINSTLGILLNVCAIPRFMRRCSSDVQVNQAANGVITSYDALAEMLQSMEHFINRLRIYAEASHSMPGLDPIVVELMVELITTLALVTRKLKKRRSREPFFVNMLLYSSRRSQMGKEFFRCQGYQ